MGKPRVILRSCDDYGLDEISGIIRESLTDLSCRIQGNVFVKPNVVSAHKKYIRHSYTHPVVVEAMIRILKEFSPNSISIGESSGYGMPTRLNLKAAGYVDMAARLKVDLFDLDERAMETVDLKKGIWHKEMRLSKIIKEADFKIWMPKLKYHVFAGITNALKLNIGILSHKERLLYHDYRIHDKIVDLLEPGYPDLVVSDAIDITYGAEAVPYPVRLGALIVSDHPLAADVAAAHIMGYAPADIKHLKRAAERGYGSLSLDSIEISGDIDIEALRAKPKGKPRLFQVLHELDTQIDFFTGFAPDTDQICDGGCECSVKGCLGMIESRYPGALKQTIKGAVISGVYQGDVLMPHGPVLMVGSCTKVQGQLKAGKLHQIEGCPVNTKELFKVLPRLFQLPRSAPGIKDSVEYFFNRIEKALRTISNLLFLKR